jgi:hypothetical protein
MDLNEILVFAKVVQAGSFIAASRELDMPKSTVSRKVSDLEERLGARLLQRTAELPELDRGKGNKIIEIPKAKRGTERVVAIAVVPRGGTPSVKSGARAMSLSFRDLDAYLGARGSRGGLLPRGWQKVDGLAVD